MDRIIPLSDGTYAIIVERWGALPYTITKELSKGFPTPKDALAWLDAQQARAQAQP